MATKLFIEEEIDEIMSFKAKLHNWNTLTYENISFKYIYIVLILSFKERNAADAFSGSRSVGSNVIYSVHDDFLVDNVFCNFSAIHELAEVHQV